MDLLHRYGNESSVCKCAANPVVLGSNPKNTLYVHYFLSQICTICHLS